MGRLSIIERMSLEQRVYLETTIRRHKYMDIDGIGWYLAEQGIHISRSVLGRHIKKLREQDYALAATNNTVVFIVERSSGKSISITTALDPKNIVSLIKKHSPP